MRDTDSAMLALIAKLEAEVLSLKSKKIEPTWSIYMRTFPADPLTGKAESTSLAITPPGGIKPRFFKPETASFFVSDEFRTMIENAVKK